MLMLILALLAGCFALWAGWRLAHPRTAWAETYCLGLLSGCAVLLHPAALPVPLGLALGVAAVWPGRAVAVLGLGAGVVGMGLLQTYAFWPPLPAWSPMLWLSGGLVWLGVVAYQLYHWRWWPPLTQLRVSLAASGLLLASATLGIWPVAWSLSSCLVALPVWAFWLARERKTF